MERHLGALLVFTAAIGCGPNPEQSSQSSALTASGAMRIVSANLTSGNGQSYDAGHGSRILETLAPDVVLIQEFRVGNNTETELQNFVDTHVGQGFSYVRESNSLPNGVISRWPILDWGVWQDSRVSNRDFVWAHIDLPGDRDLWAVSVHLLTSNASERSSEARALMTQLDLEVPTDDLLVVGGDFNTRNTSEGALQTFARRLNTSGRPADQNGNTHTNLSRNRPYDWVLASADLDALEVEVEYASTFFPSGMVFDTRLFSSGVIAPAQVRDSGASGMQHHAVVRDFLIP